jgi:hypothetical protein
MVTTVADPDGETGQIHRLSFTGGMNMRPSRLVAAAAAASVLAVGPLATGIAAAGDDTPVGVGTGTVSATLLSIELGANGDLLSVRVLGDDTVSTIDPAVGEPVSTATLSPLTITSKTAPGLNVSAPEVSTSSQGAEDKKSVEPALPSSAAFSGQLNAVLSSIVDAAGARSDLQAGLANLKVAGGLVNVPTGVLQVATDAATGKATGTQSITIPDIRVLDLTAVLEGLGLRLSDLPLDDVLDLLGSLGITIPGVPDVEEAIEVLDEAIDLLQGETGPLTAELCATVDSTLGSLGDTLGGVVGNLDQTVGDVVGQLPGGGDSPIPPGGDISIPPIIDNTVGGLFGSAALLDGIDCSTLTKTAEQLVDDLQETLGGLLGGILAKLGETSLLSVKDVRVGIVATATDSVETSVADVAASIGSVKVGNLTVPGVSGLDLTAPVAILDQASAAVQAAVGDVLAVINASLEDLVKVDLLKIEELVGADGDYTNALASVTALKATLTPPNVLGAALLNLGDPVSDVLDTVGGTVPALAPLMVQLEAALGGLDALTAPSVVTIGQLSSNAAFRPASASVPGGSSTPGGSTPSGGTPPGTLPRTGTDAALPAMLGVAMAGAAFAIRRLLRSANTAA